MAHEKKSVTKAAMLLLLDILSRTIMSGFYGLLWGLVLFPLIARCGKVACVHGFFDTLVRGLIHRFSNIGITIGFDSIYSRVSESGIVNISSLESFSLSIHTVSSMNKRDSYLFSFFIEAGLCLNLPGIMPITAQSAFFLM